MNQKIAELLSGKTTRYVFPFFWLRGEDEQTLWEYMHVIHDAGCHAVCLESRPHPDFCGPRWWHDLDIIIDEARKLDMKLWILDDSHFPTGYCNGALHADFASGDYERLRQSVTYRILGTLEGGESLSLPCADIQSPGEPVLTRADRYFMKPFEVFPDDRLLDVVAVRTNEGQASCIRLPVDAEGVRWTAGKGTWRVYGLYLTRNRGPHRDYMNMLSHESCRTLIDAVYEPHWQHYAEEFGRTILGFFSDEPEIGNGHIYQTGRRLYEEEDLPWSTELEERLRACWGRDWTLQLPLLWEQSADRQAAARVRCQYMDAVTRLVQKNFSEQIGDWCRSHGVRYIGHLIEDDGQHTRCGSSLGHYFRGLAGQDMAGIDDIGGQVLPQGEDLDLHSKWQDHRDGTFFHFGLARLASSAAALEPAKHGNAMCEIFGNYGWSEGVNLEKYLADHFMVRGINHFVPHAFSAAPFPDRDCPPHFYAHGHNPQYRHFGALVRYMERVCHMISDGRPDVHVGVLYHAEADWSGGNYQPCERIGRMLTEAQVDHHFIPADVFEERARYGTRIDAADKCLHIGNGTYHIFLIPEADFLSLSAAQGIAEMQSAGIPVLSLGRTPDAVCSGERAVPLCPVVTPEKAVQVCRAWAQVTCMPGSRMLRCMQYHGADYDLIYLVNESDSVYSGTVHFRSVPEDTRHIYRYDAWNNRCVAVQPDADGMLSGPWEPRKGYLYILDRTEDIPELAAESAEKKTTVCPLTRWMRSVCRAEAYPDFGPEREVTLPDAYELEDPSFGGFIRYETDFMYDPDATERVQLAVQGLQEGLEVFVNGQSAGIQCVPEYRFELTPFLRRGSNRIRLEQATTLERVVPRMDTVSLKPAEPTNHLGINTVVVLALTETA